MSTDERVYETWEQIADQLKYSSRNTRRLFAKVRKHKPSFIRGLKYYLGRWRQAKMTHQEINRFKKEIEMLIYKRAS